MQHEPLKRGGGTPRLSRSDIKMFERAQAIPQIYVGVSYLCSMRMFPNVFGSKLPLLVQLLLNNEAARCSARCSAGCAQGWGSSQAGWGSSQAEAEAEGLMEILMLAIESVYF